MSPIHELYTSTEYNERVLEIGIPRLTPGKTITFNSGIVSPGVECDWRLLPSHPLIWSDFTGLLARFVAGLGYSPVIAGIESGAIPHAVAVATRAIPYRYVSVRKEPKGDGVGAGMIGGDPDVLRKKHIVVVEDQVTTLGSVTKAIKLLRTQGAIVNDVLALGTYGFPEAEENARKAEVNVHVVCTFKRMLPGALKRYNVDIYYEQLIRAWMKNPRAKWEWPK